MWDSAVSGLLEFPVEREKQCLGREMIGTIRRQFLGALLVSTLFYIT